MMITGATKRIGKEAEKEFAKFGAKDYRSKRALNSANDAREEIIKETNMLI